MSTTPARPDVMPATDAAKCPDCEHPAEGVREWWRIVCAHGETDDGVGDVTFCQCRHESHAIEVVARRVVV